MADVTALVEALLRDPSQQAALRDALGIDVDVRGSLEALARAQTRTEARLDTLGQRVEELAQAQTRTEARVEELARAQARTEARVDELAKDLRALTVQVNDLAASVAGLLDVVSGMGDQLGKLSGHDLERRYRERGPAYLQQLARRLALIDSQRLAVMVDDAEADGTLARHQSDAVLLADAVFRGRLRGGDDVHLVLEVSVTVARHDVRRARDRADLLARVVDTPTIAVVAGEYVPETVAQAAQDAEVWCVMRGRILGPGDDVEDFV